MFGVWDGAWILHRTAIGWVPTLRLGAGILRGADRARHELQKKQSQSNGSGGKQYGAKFFQSLQL
jgi:hypothetical protein